MPLLIDRERDTEVIWITQESYDALFNSDSFVHSPHSCSRIVAQIEKKKGKQMQHRIAFLESFLQRNGRISLELAKLHAGRTQAEKRYINRSIQGFVYRPLTDSIILFPWLIDGWEGWYGFDRSPLRHRYRLRVSLPYPPVSIINNRKRKE